MEENNNTSWEDGIRETPPESSQYDEDQITRTTPKSSTNRRVLYVFIVIIAIGVGVWSFMGGGGPNFDEWGTHQEGAITIRVPSDRINLDEETDPDLPEVTFRSATSITRAAEVAVARTDGLAPMLATVPVSAREEMSYFLLRGAVEELVDNPDMSFGTMHGVSFESATGMYRDSRPLEFRAFVVGYEIYVVGIVVSNEDNRDLITQFFDSMEISR